MLNNDYRLYKKGVIYFKNKQYNKALPIFKKLYELYPEDQYVKFYYGTLLVRGKNNQVLGEELLKSLINTKFKASSSQELATYYLNIKNYKLAEKYFKTTTINGNKYSLINYAKLKIELKDYEGAKQLLLEALNYDDKTKNHALSELSLIEKEQGNYDKAMDYLSLLLDTESKSYALHELGRISSETGNFDKAKEYLDQALDCYNDPITKYELGKLYFDYNNLPLAEFYFTETLNSKNNNIIYISYIYLSKIEKQKRNYDNAKYYLEQVINSESNSKNLAYLELIYLYIKQEKYEEAYNQLDNLFNTNTTSNQKTPYPIIRNIIFYLKYKLNLLTKEEMENTSFYYKKQLVNYDEFDVIDHISKHLDEIGEKDNHSLFNPGIDTMNLYYACSNIIKNMEPISSSLSDIYIISYENPIGTAINKPTNTVRVVTYINSKDIISIYPVIDKKIKRRDSLCL